MRQVTFLAGLFLLLVSPVMQLKTGAETVPNRAAGKSALAAVNALNRKEEVACRSMDQNASTELWADDGVDLIQGLRPMVGKAAISKWLNALTPQLRGAKMEYCTIDWREIKTQGDWAWEWAITRQKIKFPPPQKSFENDGKMLLILKKQASGEWKIELESWSSNPEPKGKK